MEQSRPIYLSAAVRAGRWRRPLLVFGLSAAHLALLLINLARVPRTYGYDWPGHFAYLFFVDANGQSPPPELSAQFFNPPLYYFSVAGFHRLTGVPLVAAGQILNVGLALLTLALLIAICRRLWPDDLLSTALCLGFYVFNPTIYRTFGMMRPEPLLVPLFAAAAWLVLSADALPGRRVALLSGAVAGLAFGVRQWGVFLEAALALWLLGAHVRAVGWTQKGRLVATLALQGLAFALVAGFFLWIRGGNVLAFNAEAQPVAWAFVTGLELPTLFTQPVRPGLDFRFWPVLYADFWGDYWRYWWEALGRDPLPSSPATVAGLTRAMWAALPASGLALLGLFWPRRLQGASAASARRLRLFARILLVVAVAGFLIFASNYADATKGDTVKSVYLAYLTPFAGILAADGLIFLRERAPAFRWLGWATLLLLVLFVLPAGLYRPPERLVSRTWDAPAVAQPLEITFGQAYTLLGYEVTTGGGEALTVDLVWRADGYTGVSYKVFVHLLDGAGQTIAQSDAIPAGWQRPTDAWMLGEVIADSHSLATPPGTDLSTATLRVGWYGGPDNERLQTDAGDDFIQLPLEPTP